MIDHRYMTALSGLPLKLLEEEEYYARKREAEREPESRQVRRARERREKKQDA